MITHGRPALDAPIAGAQSAAIPLGTDAATVLPETPGAGESLNARYVRHCAAVERTTGRERLWHIACARGLYSLMADRELAGGEPAPMGCPHFLCITPATFSAMVRACVWEEQQRKVAA